MWFKRSMCDVSQPLLMRVNPLTLYIRLQIHKASRMQQRKCKCKPRYQWCASRQNGDAYNSPNVGTIRITHCLVFSKYPRFQWSLMQRRLPLAHLDGRTLGTVSDMFVGHRYFRHQVRYQLQSCRLHHVEQQRCSLLIRVHHKQNAFFYWVSCNLL